MHTDFQVIAGDTQFTADWVYLHTTKLHENVSYAFGA